MLRGGQGLGPWCGVDVFIRPDSFLSFSSILISSGGVQLLVHCFGNGCNRTRGSARCRHEGTGNNNDVFCLIEGGGREADFSTTLLTDA